MRLDLKNEMLSNRITPAYAERSSRKLTAKAVFSHVKSVFQCWVSAITANTLDEQRTRSALFSAMTSIDRVEAELVTILKIQSALVEISTFLAHNINHVYIHLIDEVNTLGSAVCVTVKRTE